jgi:catechol 2,3-dioxygenase-like lactoylglutathione lyase family enzyme
MSERAAVAPRFHHVGIQTTDLANAAAWYHAFIGCEPAWTLRTFSELTQSRLAGIRELMELPVGDFRLHLFERPGRPAEPPGSPVVQFQHLCLALTDPAELVELRQRWIELYDSGKFTFALPEQPTEIVIDEDGVQSFYAYDVNGLEFEFTYAPPEVGR